jgi:hypothetical protein
MNLKLPLSFLCFLTIGISYNPAQAAIHSEPKICISDSGCSDHSVKGGLKQSGETAPDYPVLGDRDWRTSGDIPYSKPVLVSDPFDGDYLAVIDHNFSDHRSWFLTAISRSGVITNWSEDYIRVYSYNETLCIGCLPNRTTQEAGSLEIKIGEELFQLSGTNGNFAVTPELASALRAAPSGSALTRIRLEESGESLTNEIGAETTAAWKIVYAER